MRIRPHVNPLRLAYQVSRATRLAFSGAEIEVEIGCADAQFLFGRAAADPTRAYVGVEIRQELVALVNQRAAAGKAPVVAVFANANVDFGRLFEPGSLARVYLNFPDPWFKARQRKRRMVDGALAQEVITALRPGGEVFFQSDVFDLALDALVVLEACPRLRNLAGEWGFWKGGNLFGARSRREEQCVAEGRAIWRLLYRRW